MTRVKSVRIAVAACCVAAASLAPATPAEAAATVTYGCTGDLVAERPLVDRDGLVARTQLGDLRVEVFYSDDDGGTTCVQTIGGDNTAAGPMPMLAMILTDDGQGALDRGEYLYRASVEATETAGKCVQIYGATQLRAFGPETPDVASDWYFLPGDAREHCND